MKYDILNAADNPSRKQFCPLIIREKLLMAYHSKSLSKYMQFLGHEVDIEFLGLTHDEQRNLYFRDVAVCRNEQRYIIARTTIPENSYMFFEQRFSISNQFPLGYFLFFGQGNIRTSFKLVFLNNPPTWFLNFYPDIKFVILRSSRWQMNQYYQLDLEEVFI